MQSNGLITREREQAERQVDRFVQRFEPSYRQLAYYAALPLVLTPELLHYLRNQFLRNVHLPWVAEADLLLSDLCTSVGYEQYAMETDVRAYLVAEMEQVLGAERLRSVAKVLLRYVLDLENTNLYLSQQEIQSQRMAAMVYVGEAQQEQVARKLAEAYQLANVGPSQQLPISAQAEMARISRLIDELAPKLQTYPQLLEFAQVVSQLLANPTGVLPSALGRTYKVAEGLTLEIPAGLKNDLIYPLPATSFPGFPPLETFEFVDAQLVEEESESTFPPPLQTEEFTVITFDDADGLERFDFTVVTLQRRSRLLRRDQWKIQRQQRSAYRLVEKLPNEGLLEMVAIPAGSFVMGSPKSEPERSDDESPQHEVTVEPFFTGRYPVTQAQWRRVSGLPQIERLLDSDPSQFKGDLRPVEQVFWQDAVEFCARLSAYTGREYRLPTEAEWEYACRAGTTTPFHFGETITTEVANHGGRTYAEEPTGRSRGHTTPVNYFEGANAFGLSDMHGNVWEWCKDHFHMSYTGAPIDGSAWITDSAKSRRVMRGGAWNNFPRNCRSARRDNSSRRFHDDSYGFRVSCNAPRT